MTQLADPFASVPPPRSGTRVTVVIPAHDEAAHIERALAALAAQRDVAGRPLDPSLYDVLVYANNCDDDTAGIARRFAAERPACTIAVAEEHLPANVAHIGTARRAAMNAASARLTAAGITDGILAATDADTVVSPTWIAWTLREMERADVVTGRIVVDPLDWAALPVSVRTMLAEENTYQFACVRLASILAPDPTDPWPRHWQRSGPSFAVRIAAYERAGGVPPVRALEDIALYDALERTGARSRHSLHVRVVTSGRFRARAPGGFADRIRAWNDLCATAPAPLFVEDPVATVARLRGESVPALPPVAVADALHALRQLIERAIGATMNRATYGTDLDLALMPAAVANVN
jgi:hypothetical protein